MDKELKPMDKFNFLIGTWKLDYKVPESRFSAEDSGEGEGSCRRILNNRYVTFDYYAKLSRGEGSAHAIFAWDEKSKIYRYWWFEDSGSFMEAACDFLDENMLCLNWHNSLLIQTFQLIGPGQVILQMRYPLNKNDYEIVLEVLFKKKK